jgi:hypothetical protein
VKELPTLCCNSSFFFLKILPLVAFQSSLIEKMETWGTLEAIKYERGKLQVLDQLQLPFITHYDSVETCEHGFESIKSMKVRGW